jgi:hypothetical protein
MACWWHGAAVDSNTTEKSHAMALDESRPEKGPQTEGQPEARAEAEEKEKVSDRRLTGGNDGCSKFVPREYPRSDLRQG